jgi:hypothetical protein
LLMRYIAGQVNASVHREAHRSIRVALALCQLEVTLRELAREGG